VPGAGEIGVMPAPGFAGADGEVGIVRTGALATGAASINAAICWSALAAPARLPERIAAKPIAKSSAIAASLANPFAATGVFTSPHLRVSTLFFSSNTQKVCVSLY
jgi:hypothetical protein